MDEQRKGIFCVVRMKQQQWVIFAGGGQPGKPIA
jgi:hypothetical protein